MDIIILTKNYEMYVSGYYHHDINQAFMKKDNYYLYGDGYPKYDKYDTIQDIINKSPFNKKDVDFIVVGTSWEVQDENIDESDPHPMIDLSKIDIPKVFFLNKEYKKLNKKLEYIKKNNFDLVCTVHPEYKKWAEQTDLHFIQLPFGVNPERFKDYGLPKKYDFGFTGTLHRDHTDIRYQIKNRIFKNCEAKSNQFMVPKWSLVENVQFEKYKIYWAEWSARSHLKRLLLPFKNRWAKWDIKSFLKGDLLPSNIEYPKFLNSFKAFFSSPGPIGIIGTRYFECMAVKTLLFCPEDEHNNIFKDGYNCITFKEDLSNFEEKLHDIISDDYTRNRVVENAFDDVMTNHTYEKRIEKVLDILGIK